MARSEPEFSEKTKEMALARQRMTCASCDAKIIATGNKGRSEHRFGEGAHAHHIKHVKLGGKSTLENCVILCWACHYSAHEGGQYAKGKVSGTPADYSHYWGPPKK